MLELITDTEYLELLGNRVRDKRLQENITQQELADFCGVSRRTISLFEKGNGVNLLSFVRILRKFDLDTSLVELIPEVNDIDPFKITKNKRERAS